MHEIPLTTFRRATTLNDVSFQFDSSSFDITKRVSTLPARENVIIKDKRFNKENFSKSDLKPKKYIVGNEDELLAFSDFQDSTLSFTFEDGDSTLVIKENTQYSSPSDKHLMKLDELADRLSHLNSLQTDKTPSIWNKVYLNLSGVFSQSKKISKHFRVTKVIVSFAGCEKVGDKGLKSLIDFLKNFENLQSLEFEVKNTKATDETLGFLSSLITGLKQLNSLYVDFSGCKISEEGIFVLANALNTKKDMKELWLRFSWCPPLKIQNEGILYICKALESFQSLQVLLMEFNGHSEITSKGLSGILTAIKGLCYMRKLFLYFENAQVSDNFLAYAGEVLPKLKGLKVFGLNLANTSFITAKGVEKLEKGLFALTGLNSGLYIYLNGCLGVRENEKVRQSFEDLINKRKIKACVLEIA